MYSETTTINNISFTFRGFQNSDIYNLAGYLNSLSDKSKKRFAPHGFTIDNIQSLADNPDYILFLAVENSSTFIIAYYLIKLGWLDFEYERLSSYGLKPKLSDCTFAPSVSDFWQGKGLGTVFFNYVKKLLFNDFNIQRYFLWGGVQSTNQQAINFYKKNGFKAIGTFEYNGQNTDMVLTITP